MSGALRVEELEDPLGELPWDALEAAAPPDRPAAAPGFLRAYLRGGVPGVETRALVLRDAAGEVVAVAPYCLAEVDLDCLAPAPVQAVAGALRGLWSRFLRIRVLFFGPLHSLGAMDVVWLRDDVDRDQGRQLLVERSLALLGSTRAHALVWKELTAEEEGRWAHHLGPAMTRYPSVPTMQQELPFEDLDAYTAALRSGYRRQLRKNLRAGAEAGLDLRLAEPLAPHLDAWLPLFEAVVARSETRLETLPQRFFEELATDHAYVLNTAHLDGRLVGGALCRVHRERLVFLYVGMDYAVTERCDLYFNLLHSVLALALASGCRSLSWGQTSLDAKGRFGAACVPLAFYLRFRSGWVDRLVRGLSPLLFPEREATARRVFRGQG